MPIALKPNATFDFTFKIDADLPDDQRPTVKCRFLTAGGSIDLQTAIRLANEAKSDIEAADILEAATQPHIAGWVNLDPPARLRDALSADEMFELAGGIVKGSWMSEIDRKKSASQSQSKPGESATAAGDHAG